ncbi:MAG: AAA family ATPase [Oscillospiraceae bacterium]|nr:AAA family ATPase [Oscillospiraceae bacterium]
MEKVNGVVSKITYRNDENNWTVFTIDSGAETVTATGAIPPVSVGEQLRVEGEWVTHKIWGKQLAVTSAEVILPEREDEILKYLSSGAVKGVRASTAKKIIDLFGADSLNVISDEPEKLATIKGISLKKAKEISANYIEQIGVRDCIMFLQKYGVTVRIATKIYNKFKTGTIKLIKANPYILCETIKGIGFRTSDEIAMQQGIERNSRQRISAGIMHVLWEATQRDGHAFLPREVLLEQSIELLGIPKENIIPTLDSMIFAHKLEKMVHSPAIVGDDGNRPENAAGAPETAPPTHAPTPSIVGDDALIVPHFEEPHSKSSKNHIHLNPESQILNPENIYLASYAHAEQTVAKAVTHLNGQKFKAISMVTPKSITLNSEQLQAIEMALSHGISVITGGPGTGKTTIIKSILASCEKAEKQVSLTAPTGRAAKRMSEMCGAEAKTIHRLLEIGHSNFDDEYQSFVHNEDNPLACDVLIIDETSMLDIQLASSLFRAIGNKTRVVLVGDVDQLPPVGAGDVLRDIIESGIIPVVKLTQIFRQSDDSYIATNAHRINKGEFPLFEKDSKDFFLVNREEQDSILRTIIESAHRRKGEDFQVLTPMRKGPLGVYNLNIALQEKLNPKQKLSHEITGALGQIFRVGDKVMQTKNNYDIEWKTETGEEGSGVFNGDIGIVTHADDEDDILEVTFDDKRKVTYNSTNITELDLAYAITVHKSQGSEYGEIIFPLFPTAPMLATRNLLYTAITRAKKMVVLVGRQSHLHTMVRNTHIIKRNSGLKARLMQLARR